MIPHKDMIKLCDDPSFSLYVEIKIIDGEKEVFCHTILKDKSLSAFKRFRKASEEVREAFRSLGITRAFVLLDEHSKDSIRLSEFIGFKLVLQDQGQYLMYQEV